MKKLLFILPFYVSSIFAADELSLIKTDIQNLEKKADRITMELRDLDREMKGLTLDEFSCAQKKSLTGALVKAKQEIAAKKQELASLTGKQ